MPLHNLIKLTPRAYGTVEERTKAGIEAVSTWRGKGSTAKHEDFLEGASKGDKGGHPPKSTTTSTVAQTLDGVAESQGVTHSSGSDSGILESEALEGNKLHVAA